MTTKSIHFLFDSNQELIVYDSYIWTVLFLIQQAKKVVFQADENMVLTNLRYANAEIEILNNGVVQSKIYKYKDYPAIFLLFEKALNIFIVPS